MADPARFSKTELPAPFLFELATAGLEVQCPIYQAKKCFLARPRIRTSFLRKKTRRNTVNNIAKNKSFIIIPKSSN